jgi:hypothetical protein
VVSIALAATQVFQVWRLHFARNFFADSSFLVIAAYSGSLELDFVQIWKPQDLDEESCRPLPEAEWNLLYEFARSTNSPVEMITALKELSDVYCFYIWQIEKLLSLSYMQDGQTTPDHVARQEIIFNSRYFSLLCFFWKASPPMQLTTLPLFHIFIQYFSFWLFFVTA